MKTERLIDSLVADRIHQPPPAGRTLLHALPMAIAAALLVFSLFLDMRSDLPAAFTSWRYLLKLLLPLLIMGAAIGLVLHLAQPQHRPGSAFRWMLLLTLPLLAGTLMEGAMLPSADWVAAAMGKDPIYCLIFVPMLSLAPLAAMLWTLRQGAPQSPVAGGAAAGLAAGGIGAFIFAIHCDNDSPFYIAIWYLGAIAIVTLLGALVGQRLLRW
jgi:hypothetical protein